VQQRRCQYRSVLGGRGVHADPGWLFHYGQLLVDVVEVQWQVEGHQPFRRRGPQQGLQHLQIGLDAHPGAQVFLSAGGQLAIVGHTTRVDQRLHSCPRQLGVLRQAAQLQRQRHIAALARGAFVHEAQPAVHGAILAASRRLARILTAVAGIYQVALLSRGSGALAYSYRGPEGLVAGQLAAVSFRNSLEAGVILGEDPQPPAAAVLPLVPLTLDACPDWGRQLLRLAQLAAALPREVTGRLLLAPPASGLRWRLEVNRTAIEPCLGERLAPLVGPLSAARRTQLLTAVPWTELAALAEIGAVSLSLNYTGQPGSTRAHPAWRRWYQPDAATLRLHGLETAPSVALPGAYLAGLMQQDSYTDWPVARELPAAPPAHVASSQLCWEALTWPQGWALTRLLPSINETQLRRCQLSWSALKAGAGLPAELATGLSQGQRLLVLAPQDWLLERLWPHLAPWAAQLFRYSSSAGPSAAAHILGRLQVAPGVACGGPGAWKLAAYTRFDRVLLLDPSHPQYEPEGAPFLDPRLALLALLAGSNARLEMVEFGLSAWDGISRLRHVELRPPFSPATDEPSGNAIDTDPLPLEYRQPGIRRLVYFNRLGSSRGLRCTECESQVACPQWRQRSWRATKPQAGQR
jgi:hypothetical protein